ncbi:MAG: hypothetical protein M1815_000543 [Lichina confinis]|nr:MAG: hypothetical protein M1815_000543 [Lichina confinis]
MAALDSSRFWRVGQDDSASPLQTPLGPETAFYDEERSESTAGLADGFPFTNDKLESSVPDLRADPFRAKDHLGLEAMTGHSSTAPIKIPSAPRGGAEPNDYGEISPAQRWLEPSLLATSFEKRRRSVAFSPRVTLDGSHERPLDDPLPKTSRRNRASRPRGRSLMCELAVHSGRPTSSACWSRAEREGTGYSPFAHSLGLNHGRSSAVALAAPQPIPATDSGRRSLLVPGPGPGPGPGDDLAEDVYLDFRERMASLTSTSTASPPPDEPSTPLLETPVELVLAPLAAPSSAQHAAPGAAVVTAAVTAKQDKGDYDDDNDDDDDDRDPATWSGPAALDRASRTRSDAFKRLPRLRQARRTVSLRSPASSNSLSPASMFLSTWGKVGAPTPEPDEAGQEVGDYVLGEQIGYGGFSVVREAHGVDSDGRRVRRAVKIVRKQLAGRTERENELLQVEFEREVSLWRCLGHRFILPLLVVYDTPLATFCFTELQPDGTLFDLVRANRRGITVVQARRYAAGLASALRYLHEDVRVVHRDVKLENCLVDRTDPASAAQGGDVLLCDFGMAEYMPVDGERESERAAGRERSYPAEAHELPSLSSSSSFSSSAHHANGTTDASALSTSPTSSIAGSLEYASPELLASQAGLVSPTTDIWAFGVVLYALLVGDLPFRHTFLPRVQMKILNGEWDEGPLRTALAIDGGADDAIELLRGCFEMDPHARWTIRDILGCAFLRGEAHDGLDGAGRRSTGHRGWL